MTSQVPEPDDEWEYEYDQNNTEVFLVDLDLTTVNRSLNPTTVNRNKRLADVNQTSAAKKRQKTTAKNKQGLSGDPNAETNGTPQAGGGIPLSQEPSSTVDGRTTSEDTSEEGIQLLDLPTSNPIVSHKGEVFSCTWIDTIGTTMFFSQPRDTSLYDPEISTSEFDLIGMSRIKLVGREAKVTPIPQKDQGQAARLERPGQRLGTIKRGNAKVNADLRKQANFLEQLMNIKKNRGEQDNVHIVMNNKVAKSIADGKLNTQRRGDEIEVLNRKVVRGDAEALRKLEQIYLGQHNDESDDDVQAVDEDLGTSMRLRSRPATRVLDSDADFEYDEPRIIGTASPSPEATNTGQTGPMASNTASNNTFNEKG